MTTNVLKTIRGVLNTANPNDVADALRKIKYGNMLEPIKIVVVGMTAIAAPVITGALVKAAATISGGLSLANGEMLPAIANIVSLRVTASGTAGSVGTYGISDSSGTAIVPPGGASAAMGVALLNDAGTTITFPNTITAFTLVYMPRPFVDLEGIWTPGV